MSHWVGVKEVGVVRVCGKDRVDLLHRLSTNDLRPLATAKAVAETVFTTEKGKMVDWVQLAAGSTSVCMQTSPGRAAALVRWVDRFTIMEDVQCVDESPAHRLLAVFGPAPWELIGLAHRPALGTWVEHAGLRWHLGHGSISPWVQALVPIAEVPAWQRTLCDRGAQVADGLKLEVERLLAGVPSPQFEFKEQVNPLELRLTQHAISFNKGCYIGQEVISRLDSYDKVARQLIGFEAAELPELPAIGSRFMAAGKPLGRVTSVLRTAEGVVLGLGMVKREAAQAGPAEVELSHGTAAVQRVDRPFWQKSAG